ncbi:hypothetical protein Pcinc_003320 [Petrolisthes cinctipes]|uniref:PHD-type domain-containing protein n=1 Tax=Petrolisthes cinctipes TaxID=88211 RepID=A0AAE1GJL1_PETCI|nr:hypothetical protein Pcinc_003320 [Petrolisthes cinctipes]
MGSPVDELCLVCHERDDGKVKWLKCLKCKLGGHSTCMRMTGLKSNASEVNWVCDPCALVIKSEVHLREEINVMTDGVTLAVEEAVSAQSGQVEKDGMNWAEVVSRCRKRKRTQKNKNILIIKAKGSKKAVDMKKEVEELLSDVQIMDSKFTNKGNIVINLESEEKRNAAQNKLHEVGNLIASNGKRWDPKIMHEGRSCQSDVRKCFNCAASKCQSEHSVSSLSCPIFTSEVNRIRLNTNHGF